MKSRLITARVMAGLSIGQAAKLIGVNPAWLAKQETEPPTLLTDLDIARLADIYGVSVAWLRGESVTLPESTRKVLRDVEDTDDRQRLTELLEATQGAPVTPFEMVREFHTKYGVSNSSTPDISKHRDLRLALIAEEFRELRDAIDANDVVETADALADLLYVVIGSALQWGIPLDRVLAEVHRSNMTKDGGGKRIDGKILKGPGYEPPDVAGVLNGVSK